MTKAPSSRLKKTFRFCWRSFRTLVVVLALVLVAFGIHLHNVGLPDFIKRRLIHGLQEQGWDVDYVRLRFRWMHGIVGEGLHFKPVSGRSGPELFVDRVDFQLNREDLKDLILTPEVLTLREGRCIWTLPATSEHRARSLVLDEVNGTLRYNDPDRYQLLPLKGKFHGIEIRIQANLTNGSHLAKIRWPRSQSPDPTDRGLSTEEFLSRLAAQLDRCRVGANSQVFIQLNGDAVEANSFTAEVNLELPSVDTPWLTGTQVRLSAKAYPPAALSRPFEFRWKIEGSDCETPWGRARRLDFNGNLFQSVRDPLPERGNLQLQVEQTTSPWALVDELSLDTSFQRASNSASHFDTGWQVHTKGVKLGNASSQEDHIEARFRLAVSNWNPLIGQIQVRSREIEMPEVQGHGCSLSLEFHNPETNYFWVTTNTIRGATTLRLQRPILKPFEALETKLSFSADRLGTPGLQSSHTTLEATWAMPWLRLDALRGELNGGRADVQAQLNMTNRQLTVTLTNTSDPHLLTSILKTNTQRWLAQYGWKQPPWIGADAELTLPPWARVVEWMDSSQKDSRPALRLDEEIMPSFRLRAQVRVAEGDFRGATFTSARTSIFGSNQLWRLPDIVAVRPEGILELEHQSDESTHEYLFKIRSGINPAAVRPLLAVTAQDEFDLFRFGTAPRIEGEVRGRWRSPERMDVTASMLASNISFRGESVDALQIGHFRFANRMFFATNLVGYRKEGTATVSQVWYHLDDKKVRITNAVSSLDIAPVCRAIGPQVAQTMSDYVFTSPPKVILNGLIDTLKARRENDLHFKVDAQGFAWKIFNLNSIRTSVDWVNTELDVREVQGAFYGGALTGGAHFDFSVDAGTGFKFDLAARGVDLGLLMRDVSSKTNRLEGKIDCDLFITQANTRDKFTWNGYGSGQLTNGLLWDIPVFSMISPALNTVIPGLGNSRARRAVGTFGITNGVIYTDDLDIRATGMRMKSSGNVDFDHKISARMEAELLRDTPAIGFILSKLLWPVTKLFEFKISGTLDKPKTDQLYMVPRLLLAPLHPIKTIKDLFKSDEKPEAVKSEKP